VSSSSFAVSRPGRLAVWRQIRALRSHPPGRAADSKDRKRVFGSALEQAEQLFTAAGAVGYASRPILLFYGLSQAGRAIAAASTAADNNSYKLRGHGIQVPDLDQGPPLPRLTVKDDRRLGSFTQLASMLGSVSLRDGVPLGQLWATIPDLLATPLEPVSPQYLPVLQLQPVPRLGDGRGGGVANAVWVVGLPPRAGGYRPGDIDEEEVSAFLSNYPTLAGTAPSWLEESFKTREDLRVRGTVRLLVSASPDGDDQPYRDDRDRWVFPPLDDRGKPLHPLLAWWALLFALSMLARYEPASWVSALDADASPNHVPLAAALDQALDTCPELILRAISAVAC
jgi:hypothetical protein